MDCIEANQGVCHKKLNGERLTLEVKLDKCKDLRRVILKLRFAGYAEKYSITLLDPFVSVKTEINPDEECIVVAPIFRSTSREKRKRQETEYYYFPRHYPVAVESFYRNLHFVEGREDRGRDVLSFHQFGKNYVIPVCVNIPAGMSGNEFLKEVNEILDLCSLVIAYNFACLRMKREIVKKIANKLFKPWNITLYRHYKDYNSLKLLAKKNLDSTKDALQSILPFKEEVLNKDSIEQIVKGLKHLEKKVSEEAPIAENKVEDLVGLHLFSASIFITVITVIVTVLLHLTGILNPILKSSFPSLLSKFLQLMEGKP